MSIKRNYSLVYVFCSFHLIIVTYSDGCSLSSTVQLTARSKLFPYPTLFRSVRRRRRHRRRGGRGDDRVRLTRRPGLRAPDAGRSEEHTSELQSPCNLVCRLLLEKKKRNESQG